MAFTGDYATILQDENITITWKFAVTDKNGNVLHASNQDIIEPGTKFIASETKFIASETKFIATQKTHDFRIVDFSGISLKRNNSEVGIQTADTLNFSIDNSDSAFTASDFITGNVVLQLNLNSPTISELNFYSWKFVIQLANETPSKLIKIKAIDIVQQAIDEDYPRTKLISDIVVPGANRGDLSACVPVPIGKPYIPLTPVYHDGISSTLYLLGPITVNGAAVTYTVYKAKSPKEVGNVEYTEFFNQTTIDGYRYFYLTPTNGGPTTANIMFQNGERLYDLPVQFSRSDTAALTNPADAIQFILEDMGLEIDPVTFASAKTIYTTRTLVWNRAWRYKTPSKNIFAELQNSCASSLRSQETVELIPFDATSLTTISNDNVYLTGNETSEDSFSLRNVQNNSTNDSGYVAAQEADIPQDVLIRVIVPAGGDTTDNPTSDTLNLFAVQDSQDVQKLGIMYFQKKLDKLNELSFVGQPELLSFLPDQIVSIGTDYAESSTKVIVESLNISSDFKLSFKCLQFSHELEGWDDITVSGYTINEDQTETFYSPICGSGTTSYNEARPIKNISYEIYNSEVIRTDSAVATNGGVEMSNYGLKAYDTDSLLMFDLDIAGKNLDLTGNLTIKAGNDILVESAGDIFIEGGVLGLYNAAGTTQYAELSGTGLEIFKGGDITLESITGTGIDKRASIIFVSDTTDFNIGASFDDSALMLRPVTEKTGIFTIGWDFDESPAALKPFEFIDIYSDQRTALTSWYNGGDSTAGLSFNSRVVTTILSEYFYLFAERADDGYIVEVDGRISEATYGTSLRLIAEGQTDDGYVLQSLRDSDPGASVLANGQMVFYTSNAGANLFVRGKDFSGNAISGQII